MSLGAESPTWGNAGAAGRAGQVDSGRAEACRAMSRCVRLVVSCLVESSPVEARSVASSQSGRVASWHAKSRRVQAGQSCLYLSSRAVSSSVESVPSSLARFCRVEPCPVSRAWSCGGKFGRVLSGPSSLLMSRQVGSGRVRFRLVSPVWSGPVWPRLAQPCRVKSVESRFAASSLVEFCHVRSVELSRVATSPVTYCRVGSVVFCRVRFGRVMQRRVSHVLPGSVGSSCVLWCQSRQV